MRTREMAVIAALAVCVVPAMAQSGNSTKQDQALAAKVKEAKDKAAEVTKALTNAASNGSQDAQTLQSLIDQLKAITDRLSHLEDEVSEMKKPAQASSPSPLGKTAVGGFVQMQYRASANPGEF